MDDQQDLAVLQQNMFDAQVLAHAAEVAYQRGEATLGEVDDAYMAYNLACVEFDRYAYLMGY